MSVTLFLLDIAGGLGADEAEGQEGPGGPLSFWPQGFSEKEYRGLTSPEQGCDLPNP